jgi:hypothetical protein
MAIANGVDVEYVQVDLHSSKYEFLLSSELKTIKHLNRNGHLTLFVALLLLLHLEYFNFLALGTF